MTYWVASMVDEDEDRMLPKEASMVKLFVTETAKRVTLRRSAAAPPRSSAGSSRRRSGSSGKVRNQYTISARI